jgi:hypothetical protein
MEPLGWSVVVELLECGRSDLRVNGVKIHAVVALIQRDWFVDDLVAWVFALLNFRFEVGLQFPKGFFLPSRINFSIYTFVFLCGLLLSNFQLKILEKLLDRGLLATQHEGV